MNKHAVGSSLAIVYGLVSGLVLNFLFKIIELTTGERVYTLLLNVDYFPLIGGINFPEWIEIVFHLLVSISVSLGFYMLFYLRTRWKEHAILFCMIFSVFIGVALYPTTVLSERTPDLSDGIAFMYWLVGHAIFGILLGSFFSREFLLRKRQ